MRDAEEVLSVLNSSNAQWLAGMFAQYRADASSVDASWRAFFDELGATHGGRSESAVSSLPEWQGCDLQAVRRATLDSLRALMLIRAYRVRGHMMARLDPLGLHPDEPHPELDPATYGFKAEDWDRPIFIDFVLGLEFASIRQIVQVLRETYCGSIGVEFMHIQDPAQKAWIQERIEEIHNRTDFTERGRRTILERITAAEGLERFLHAKFPGTKRFGLDGGEALIPAIEQVLKRGSQMGVKEVVLGMSHRGRLNVLTNIMLKRFAAVFAEFQGQTASPDGTQGSGDVKYHLGASADREFDGKMVHLSLTANPSHLEAVNAVALGKTRAKQYQRADDQRDEVLCLLMHGDAAFAGQGLVAETLAMSQLKGYRTGGTIHFVVNNQIGFTTVPAHSRSGHYATDVALMVHAPVFHVNGDDAEAVVHVARLATEYRQLFRHDIVVDLYCYRRFGHNEGDEPFFTQPKMYRTIKDHPTTREIYAKQLVAAGVVHPEDPEQMVRDFRDYLEAEFAASASYKPDKADWLEGRWSGLGPASKDHAAWQGDTGVDAAVLREIGRAVSRVPETFSVHPKIARQLETKAAMFDRDMGIDWATGEALAFGSLLIEGYDVRLSGQDCGRGTFSHRHAKLYDQETEEKYMPLNHIRPTQGTCVVLDSPLNEAGVLGFEYGYSLAEPNALVLWEAQFGDFANGAQVMIDQFISSAQSKWLRLSGLVMLLPHGYEGQGPEHSSARIERYLQLCAEDNWQVVNTSTPANYFHVLRRQLKRKFRKPLVVFTPKSLLRHPRCVSSLSEFEAGVAFRPLIGDETLQAGDRKVKRVVLCSGKVYYDLLAAREEAERKDVALVRVEQLYPFPEKELREELAKYPSASDLVWCQEEPQNMGAWSFVDRRLEQVLLDMDHRKMKRPLYVGRVEAASPATGSLKRHQSEQAALVSEALGSVQT